MTTTERDDDRNGYVFVIMPFADPFNVYYQRLIRPSLSDIGYEAVRSDEVFSPQAFIQTIWEQILGADAIVAEMTTTNPNVLYELGLCHAIGKKVIMLSQRVIEVPSDLRHINCIVYDTTAVGWEAELRRSIQQMILSPTTDASAVLRPIASIENTSRVDELNEAMRTSKTREDAERARAQVLEEANAQLTAKAGEMERALTHDLSPTSTLRTVRLSNDDAGRPLSYVQVPGTDLLQEYVHVPEGRFTYGSGPSATEVDLPAYWISRYSVTNEHYCAFLNLQGNRLEEGLPWVELHGRSPVDHCRIRHDGQRFDVEPGYERHPITYVNYYGAAAFASWMGGALPSSEMWERAARGDDGRMFPWGNTPPSDTTANVPSDGLWPRDVAPIEVDLKPEGASPIGLVQAVGNVWHWTSTHFPDRDVQVVRGGTFFDFRLGARRVYRFQVSPDGPDLSQGFLVSIRYMNA